jgi:hypothetical protein
MSYDHFRPPEHFSPAGKFAYRAVLTILFLLIMAAFVYFVVPVIQIYVSKPLSTWVGDLLFGPKGA